VPVCTDCHNEHDIRSPSDLGSVVYATKVAAVCARCHDDERLARQYGLLTSRLKTFASSYHGMASKSGETRVANCSSRHPTSPSTDRSRHRRSQHRPTCGTCHPAPADFSRPHPCRLGEDREPLSLHRRVVYLVVIGG
jgi:predicted CXXCH cytochrome family protein